MAIRTRNYDDYGVTDLGEPGGSAMMYSTPKTRAYVAVLVSLASLVGTASAETTWQKNHPRRTQVNHRLANQSNRIRGDVKDGTLTRGQAQSLRHDDRQVAQEERDMASQNGGHITGSEQRVLNSQENGISNQIPPK
jgi:hypothetical protein